MFLFILLSLLAAVNKYFDDVKTVAHTVDDLSAILTIGVQRRVIKIIVKQFHVKQWD